MKQTFDIESILYNILSGSSIPETISGGIYLGNDRPDDSTKEDIVINTISLTQDYHPQIGTSNVNIYVEDMLVKIDNKHQSKSNRVRLKELSSKVITELKNARVPGLLFQIDSQVILAEPFVKQHCVNLRISWNIQTD